VFVKVGTGTQILTGSNTTTAGATVNGGRLLVYNTTGSGTGPNGAILTGGTGSTFGGGTLDGSGGIAGPLSCNSNSNPINHVAPSSSTGDTGILHVGSLGFNGEFDVDIAGVTAGTLYDQIVTTTSASFVGSLHARFLNGFQNSIQPTDVFDFLVAGTGTISRFIDNLNGSGRLNAFGTQGSFAVQLVNGGKTLRLTDFQTGSVTFESWASAHSLSGANAALTADPDGDGLSNLAEYAFGRDPNATDGGALAQTQIVTVAGSKYLALSYTRPAGANAATDITYTPQRTTDLAVPWSSADIVVQSIAPGPGTLETVTVRSTHPMNTMTKEFLRVSVSKP
jgi:autotransporter-associated beta strand protein